MHEPIDKPNAPDGLWLNAGDGTSFTQQTIPEVTTGSGDFALPIDYDQNGYGDFIVLNGHGKTTGPLELLASMPAPAAQEAAPPLLRR